MPNDPTTAAGQVRLLISDIYVDADVNPAQVFKGSEIVAFLAMEGGSVKRAAAQALDTIASNEALVSKVIRTQDVGTDGAKVAQVLHQRAAVLRSQADAEAEAADGFEFAVSAFEPYGSWPPELTEWPYP